MILNRIKDGDTRPSLVFQSKTWGTVRVSCARFKMGVQNFHLLPSAVDWETHAIVMPKSRAIRHHRSSRTRRVYRKLSCIFLFVCNTSVLMILSFLNWKGFVFRGINRFPPGIFGSCLTIHHRTLGQPPRIPVDILIYFRGIAFCHISHDRNRIRLSIPPGFGHTTTTPPKSPDKGSARTSRCSCRLYTEKTGVGTESTKRTQSWRQIFATET